MSSPEQDHAGRRLTDLTMCALHRRTILLTCSCGHSRGLDAVPLWWLFSRRGWSDVLTDARWRFYCSVCWSTRCRKMSNPKLEVTDVPPSGPQLFYPDERVWNRLVSRYRS